MHTVELHLHSPLLRLKLHCENGYENFTSLTQQNYLHENWWNWFYEIAINGWIKWPKHSLWAQLSKGYAFTYHLSSLGEWINIQLNIKVWAMCFWLLKAMNTWLDFPLFSFIFHWALGTYALYRSQQAFREIYSAITWCFQSDSYSEVQTLKNGL